MALSDKFIEACRRLRLSWDHLGDFLVNFLLFKLPMVTWMGVPPVGKLAVPPFCCTPSSSNICFKLDATTLPLDFLDLDLTIPARLLLISFLVQM